MCSRISPRHRGGEAEKRPSLAVHLLGCLGYVFQLEGSQQVTSSRRLIFVFFMKFRDSSVKKILIPVAEAFFFYFIFPLYSYDLLTHRRE